MCFVYVFFREKPISILCSLKKKERNFLSVFLSAMHSLHSLKNPIYMFFFPILCGCFFFFFTYSKTTKYLAVNLGLCSGFFFSHQGFSSRPHKILPHQGFRSSGFIKLYFL